MRQSMGQVAGATGGLEQAGCGLCSPTLEDGRDRSRPEDASGAGGTTRVRTESVGRSVRCGRLRAGRAASTATRGIVVVDCVNE